MVARALPAPQSPPPHVSGRHTQAQVMLPLSAPAQSSSRAPVGKLSCIIFITNGDARSDLARPIAPREKVTGYRGASSEAGARRNPRDKHDTSETCSVRKWSGKAKRMTFNPLG